MSYHGSPFYYQLIAEASPDAITMHQINDIIIPMEDSIERDQATEWQECFREAWLGSEAGLGVMDAGLPGSLRFETQQIRV